MNSYTKKKIVIFMEVLKNLGLTEDQVCGVASMMKTEAMAQEILDELESKDFKTTPQETMNICAECRTA